MKTRFGEFFFIGECVKSVIKLFTVGDMVSLETDDLEPQDVAKLL
jgi:hypothetical protein